MPGGMGSRPANARRNLKKPQLWRPRNYQGEKPFISRLYSTRVRKRLFRATTNAISVEGYLIGPIALSAQ